MFHQNFEMTNALSKSKQYKPLMIEGVVIDVPQRTSVWRKRMAATFRWLADAIEQRPMPAQAPAYSRAA